ncbi:MAG: hypothetical protein AAGI15_15830 [Pseudomonadota bacterium]
MDTQPITPHGPPAVRLLVLLLLVGALLAVALTQLRLSYALTFFLPQPATAPEQILSSRLGQGPGAALLFVDLGPGRGPLRDRLALDWRDRAPEGLTVIWPALGSAPEIPAELLGAQPWLAPPPATEAAWRTVLDERAADLASAPDDTLYDLVAIDPTLATVTALSRFLPPVRAQPRAQTTQGPLGQVLVLRAAGPVFDTARAGQVLRGLEAALAQAGAADAAIYGSPAYGARLQETVAWESTLFTSAAGLALALLVLARFRAVQPVLISALPLLTGAVAGLAVLAITAERVHGITLAFGFTLLGVAIDYPLHVLTHRRVAQSHSDALWPTLVLGILSTLLAFGAFLLSGTQGISQLGLFALAGISAAALATRWLDAPLQSPDASAPIVDTPVSSVHVLNHAPWLLVLTFTLPVLLSQPLFNDDLSALTPVPPDQIAADNALRSDFAAFDMRYLIAVQASSEAAVLEATAMTAQRLSRAIEAGELTDFSAVTALLPAPSQQAHAQRLLRADPDLERAAFAQALAMSPFAPEAFAPYWQRRAQAREAALPALTLESFSADAPLGMALRTQLYEDAQGWTSLIYLRGLTGPAALRNRLQESASTRPGQRAYPQPLASVLVEPGAS